MQRATIGAGALALALALSACGASPSAPAADSTSVPGAAESLPTAAVSEPTAAPAAGSSDSTGTTGTTGSADSSSAYPSPESATGATSAAGTSSTSAAGTSATSAAGTATDGDTIVDAAAADPRFSTLVGLLEATGLSQQLAEAGPFTVFAPTNEAFTALPAGTLEALAQDPQLLQEILLYHVAQGELRSSDVASTASATTVAGEEIQIDASSGSVTLNGTAQVVETDIAVGNGVIHVIDQVLLPPDVSLPSAG